MQQIIRENRVYDRRNFIYNLADFLFESFFMKKKLSDTLWKKISNDWIHFSCSATNGWHFQTFNAVLNFSYNFWRKPENLKENSRDNLFYLLFLQTHRYFLHGWVRCKVLPIADGWGVTHPLCVTKPRNRTCNTAHWQYRRVRYPHGHRGPNKW